MYLSGDGRFKVTATPYGNTKAVIERVELGRHSPFHRRGSFTMPTGPPALAYRENFLLQ
jgi:hypothetical protein